MKKVTVLKSLLFDYKTFCDVFNNVFPMEAFCSLWSVLEDADFGSTVPADTSPDVNFEVVFQFWLSHRWFTILPVACMMELILVPQISFHFSRRITRHRSCLCSVTGFILSKNSWWKEKAFSSARMMWQKGRKYNKLAIMCAYDQTRLSYVI